MGHKPWDMPWRRAERRRAKQQWQTDMRLASLEEVITEHGFTQAEIDAAPD